MVIPQSLNNASFLPGRPKLIQLCIATASLCILSTRTGRQTAFLLNFIKFSRLTLANSINSTRAKNTVNFRRRFVSSTSFLGDSSRSCGRRRSGRTRHGRFWEEWNFRKKKVIGSVQEKIVEISTIQSEIDAICARTPSTATNPVISQTPLLLKKTTSTGNAKNADLKTCLKKSNVTNAAKTDLSSHEGS